MNRVLETLILKNFQSHEDTVIHLDSGLNVFVGHSDSGKTSILRALNWALYNEPRGDYFVQHGKSEVSVTMIFSDGIKVERFRTKSKNGYRLDRPGMEEQIFEGFGTEIPKEIRDLIQSHKLKLSDKEEINLNVAHQLEGPFLLGEKGSTKALAIGRMVGTHWIDRGEKKVLSDIRSLQRKEKFEKEEILNLQEQVKRLDWVEDRKALYEKRRILLDKASDRLMKWNRCKQLSAEYINVRKEIITLSEEKAKWGNLDQVNQMLLASYGYENAYSGLKRLREQYHFVGQKKQEENRLLCKLQFIEPWQEKFEQLYRMERTASRYKKLSENYHQIHTMISKTKKVLEPLIGVERGQKVYDELSQREKQLLFYSSMKEQAAEVRSRIEYGNKYLQRFAHISGIRAIKEKLDDVEIRKNRLLSIRHQMVEVRAHKAELIKENKKRNALVNALNTELEGLWANLSLCPYCGQSLEGKSHKEE